MFQRFEISQVLRSANGAFILDQSVSAENKNRNAIEFSSHLGSFLIAFINFATRLFVRLRGPSCSSCFVLLKTVNAIHNVNGERKSENNVACASFADRIGFVAGHGIARAGSFHKSVRSCSGA